MSQIITDFYRYDPRDYRTDTRSILWGFVLLCAVLAALFLV